MFISELFRDIWDSILLILHYRTLLFFRATSFSTYTMLDVRSICILSSTLDSYLEVKVRARDRQYSSCLSILWTSHKDPDVIDLSVQRHAQYLHKAWNRHQDAVYWDDINLAIKQWWIFYQTRSNAIILQETLSGLFVFRNKLGWKLEKSYTKECTCHLRLHQ